MSTHGAEEKAMNAKMSWKSKLTNRRKYFAERKAGKAKKGKGAGKVRGGRGCKEQDDDDEPVIYECEFDCGFCSIDFGAVELHEAECDEGKRREAASERKESADDDDGQPPGSGAGAAATAEAKADLGVELAAEPAVDFGAGLTTFGVDARDEYVALLVRLGRVLLPEAIAAIDGCAVGDSAALSAAIHKLKGSAGYVGAVALQRSCAEARMAIAEAVRDDEEQELAAALLAEVHIQAVHLVKGECARVVSFLRTDDRTRELWLAGEGSKGRE